MLSALAFIDAREQRLPDILTLPLMVFGLIAGFLNGMPLWSGVSGAAIGYASMVAMEIGYRRVRGADGLGRGDAKLFAAAGAWCGLIALPYILLLASASALIFVLTARLAGAITLSAKTRIAFGPFLAFGIAVVWIWNNAPLA
ncbi:A24 family peptidase [uncultured Maricaulis sp.]|uniref:prepilin peptidase n=1 Tax=uncultured Maricaulis sp. TaxID=174710 RepID=UPI0030DA35BA